MKRERLERIRREWLDTNFPYRRLYFAHFDYKILHNILWQKRAGRGGNETYNDCIIMGDTETSKKRVGGDPAENHVVAWTISIRAFGRNIVTLWGRKPSDMISTIKKIQQNMEGENTYIYFHNLSYDWVFLRRFFFLQYGYPDKQLNTKPHYPIYIHFVGGLILRDSLILSQRSLEKWAKDMDVEHKKAVGFWDYNKIRTQHEKYTADELTYIENDTLAGVECIDALKQTLNKHIYSMPYTATGIPREETRIRGKMYHAHEWFKRIGPTWEQQEKLEKLFHGGYTHGNRHLIEEIIRGRIICFDFASSYPFVLLSRKYPAERFIAVDNCSIDYILSNKEDYAYMFKLILYNFRLKDDFTPMPVLQQSKSVKDINLVCDNGRVLCGAYMEIYVNETDLDIINRQYTAEKSLCVEVECACKEYLPRWFTDYVFQLFVDKQMLKGGDPVLYAIAKAKLNSLFGLTVQKPVRDDINENYETGAYEPAFKNLEEEYQKYFERHTSILPYFIGVWVTSYAMHNLFELGETCIDYDNGGSYIYSDTDSIYATGWNMEAVDKYNEKCKEQLLENGYGPAMVNGKEYWLGIATKDGEYTEFRTCGAKRYCDRSIEDGKLHITVAGVPKKGAECLKDDIENFKTGFIFPGTKTGKQLHTYFYNDIYTDAAGNETGDSIDLSPCDYLLDSVNTVDWDKLWEEEVQIQVYDEE